MANPAGTIQAHSHKGFTLVELMIAMAVGGMVLAAVMTAFLSQHETYLAQDEVVEMQQNARVAMDSLTRDIRSIGFDPDGLGAGLTTAAIGADGRASTLRFTRGDGAGALERINYALVDAYASTGGNDGRVDDLGRDINGGGLQPVAENVSQIEFLHLNGNNIPTNSVGDVRAIQVSLMVETANPATRSMPRQQVYTTPGGVQWTSTPGHRSIYLTSTIFCRNLGL